MSKICSRCNENKSLNQYFKDSIKKDGHQSHCKTCHTKIMTDRYQALREFTESFKTNGCLKCR